MCLPSFVRRFPSLVRAAVEKPPAYRFPHTLGLVGLIFTACSLFTACTVQAPSLFGQLSKLGPSVREDYCTLYHRAEQGVDPGPSPCSTTA